MFGDRDSGAYLLKFAWVKITRHTLVKGWASPDDPALASPQSVSSTPTADAACQTATTVDQHSCKPDRQPSGLA